MILIDEFNLNDIDNANYGATNGDMIKTMFPSCKQKEYMSNDYFEMYFDADLKNASYMRVSKDWWNAPYKKGGEE